METYRVHIIGKFWTTGSGWSHTEDLGDCYETLAALPDQEHQEYWFDNLRDNIREMDPETIREAADAVYGDTLYVVSYYPADADTDANPLLSFSRWHSELAQEFLG